MRNFVFAFMLGFILLASGVAIADQLSLPKARNGRTATDSLVVYGNYVEPNGAAINWSVITMQVGRSINWQTINTTTGNVNWENFANTNAP